MTTQQVAHTPHDPFVNQPPCWMPAKFETEICSRCGGTGHYSFCQMYGTVCFKCRGAKEVLTKRGAAAVGYRKELRSFPVEQVQAGWLMYHDGFMGGKRGWHVVTEIRDPGSAGRVVNGETIWGIDVVTAAVTVNIDHGQTVDSVVPNKDYLWETTQRALAYQATLTKTGTVRKERARVAS